MTNCAYSIIGVPLGRVLDQSLQDGSHAQTFRVSLATNLEVLQPFSEQDLCHIVDANPLWHADNLGYVFARISGTQPPAPDQVVRLEPEIRKEETDTFRLRLKTFLLGRSPSTARVAKREPHLASPDGRFDLLPASAFFDTQKAYEESIPARDLAAYAMSLGLTIKSTSNEQIEAGRISPRLMRLANAMVMQDYLHELYIEGDSKESRDRLSRLLQELLGTDPGLQTLGQSPGKLREELLRHAHRIHGYEATPDFLAEDPSIGEEELKALMDAREPNSLLRIAARDPVLSAQFGLTTHWKLTLPSTSTTISPAVREFSLHIERWPDTHGLTIDFNLNPTVFNTDTHVYPTPRNPLGSNTSGFAWLNQRKSDQNYRVLQVNADQEIMKAWVLQDANSLRTHAKAQAPRANIKEPCNPAGALSLEQASGLNSDKRVQDKYDEISAERPKLLRGQETGVNQPECKGVTFSASTLDLADAGDAHGVNARRSESRYYLEDLWVGYRIDVARVYDGGEQGAFFSLNAQLADVEVVNTGMGFPEQEAESFFDREQLCIDRPTGVEITTWTGIAESQQFPFIRKVNHELPSDTPNGCDYEDTKNLDPNELVVWRHKLPVGKLPRLRYGWTYRYRIRNVFAGGVSLSIDDADGILSGAGSSKLREAHTQTFDFRRVEAYSPGELANPAARTSQNRASPDSEQRIFLLEDDKDKAIYVLPRPIDLTEMRFGGIVGNSPHEAVQLHGVAETRNVRQLLFGEDGKLKDKRYFLDREVNAILVRADIRNRNEECAREEPCASKPENEVIDGIELTTVEPWNIATKRLEFGRAGRWQSFKPIRLTFRAASNQDTTMRSHGRSGAVLSVAPGDHVELSLVPDVSEEQIKQSYFYGNANRHATRQASRGFVEVTFKRTPLPTPPIIAERTIEVIHATRRPLKTPTLEFDPRYQLRESAKQVSMFRLRRSSTNSDAYFVGSIGVHAPSTGEVRLEARWKVIDDKIDPKRPILVDGFARSETRSVQYSPREPLTGDEALQIVSGAGAIDEKVKRLRVALEQQCLENSVHLPLPAVTIDSRAAQVCNALNFKDLGRRIATLTAHATPRYRDLYPSTAEDRVSDPFAVDVPSRQMPSAPEVAIAVPTFANSRLDEPGRMGLRFYLKRPWFETGVGERCAIGCIFRETDDDVSYAMAKQYATHWGEDVFERPKLTQTLRIPRASDFEAPAGAAGEELDSTFYPAFDPRERELVLYEDGVPLAVEVDTTDTTGVSGPGPAIKSVTGISLASYALKFDQSESSYYFDVIVRGGFFGWLKLALYRHQPCSVDGFALSPVPTHVYAAVMQEDVLTKVDEGVWTVLRIGPVFDRTVSFVASEADLLGDGVYMPSGAELQLSEQIIGSERYFVLRIPKNMTERLVIYKTRAGVRQWAFPT